MQYSKDLPGSPRHQSLLRTIAAFYASDNRILAALVFGSVARDTWDDYSDLDLAVVVRDGVDIDIPSELHRVSAALAERVLFIEVADDQGFLVLESLSGIAVRYHPLRSTDPYVLEGMHLLIASLDEETIRTAAKANRHLGLSLSQQVHQALWLALGADIMLQRQQIWRALPWLGPMRRVLLEMFAASHGGKRAYEVFEAEAGAELRVKFGRTFPQYFPDSASDSARSFGDALTALLNLVEQDLDELSNGQAHLGLGEREVISGLRARQAALRLTI